MADIKKKSGTELDYYQGEHAIESIRFHTAGQQLGVTAWGMNLLELAPNCSDYPEHDHVKDGQEEVYVVLNGGGYLQAGAERYDLQTGDLIRVGPAEKRKIYAGPQGIRFLAIGATPGKAYPSS